MFFVFFLLLLALIFDDEHIYLSKTCVAFFSCGLTPNYYFLAFGNLSYFAQFVLLLQFVICGHIAACFVIAACSGFGI